jgi:MFS family permease
MMITQSFLYNAIFFTYILVLKNFYGLQGSTAEKYFFPFAVGNLLGPLVLGHLFDTIGRRKMIFGTYFISGAILAISAFLFVNDALSALTQTLGAGVMIFGGLIAWFFGVNAEGQSLEDVADPLSRVDTPPPRETAAV